MWSLTFHDDGSGRALYAGGVFDAIGEVGAQAIARWDGCEPPCLDLGGGTEGSAGSPNLELAGPLTPSTLVHFDLTSGLPAVFVAFGSAPTLFLGGTLHAFPYDDLALLQTDATGSIHGSASVPGAATGSQLIFQVVLLDDDVPVFGASLSNGVRGVVP